MSIVLTMLEQYRVHLVTERYFNMPDPETSHAFVTLMTIIALCNQHYSAKAHLWRYFRQYFHVAKVVFEITLVTTIDILLFTN